jgi:hypothetical protein
MDMDKVTDVDMDTDTNIEFCTCLCCHDIAITKLP